MLRLSLVLMLLFASPVRADTGNYLYEQCTTDLDIAEAYCIGYSTAIVDAMNNSSPLFGWIACVPDTVYMSQVADIGIRHLANNPQDRHYNAASLIAEALSKAFPC